VTPAERELREQARELLAATTRASGVPLHVEDPLVLADVARRLAQRANDRARQARRARPA
jgi:hypothetical protein